MNIYEQLESIDFSAFLEFPPACPIRNRPTVKITDDVRMLLCGTLRKEALERQRDYCVGSVRMAATSRFIRSGKRICVFARMEAPPVTRMWWNSCGAGRSSSPRSMR